MRWNGRLVELRTGRGWTQAEVAEKLEIPRTTYAMYEQGRRQPTLELLDRLATLFTVSVDDLLGRTPSVERIAAHMEGQYGDKDPEFAEYLVRIINHAVDEWKRGH